MPEHKHKGLSPKQRLINGGQDLLISILGWQVASEITNRAIGILQKAGPLIEKADTILYNSPNWTQLNQVEAMQHNAKIMLGQVEGLSDLSTGALGLSMIALIFMTHNGIQYIRQTLKNTNQN
ncbi:MAG: hypothetical protein WC741_03490 [Patescibacteria group bacterium]|jgi:hypothetical protein